MSANDTKAVKVLIENGADINTRSTLTGNSGTTYSETILESAIQLLDKKLVIYLLKKKADPHLERTITNSLSILRDPSDYYNVIKWEAGRMTCTSVYIALRTENLEVFSILIDGGADINKICVEMGGYSLTPLQAAIFHEQKEFIEFLLSKDAKI